MNHAHLQLHLHGPRLFGSVTISLQLGSASILTVAPLKWEIVVHALSKLPLMFPYSPMLSYSSAQRPTPTPSSRIPDTKNSAVPSLLPENQCAHLTLRTRTCNLSGPYLDARLFSLLLFTVVQAHIFSYCFFCNGFRYASCFMQRRAAVSFRSNIFLNSLFSCLTSSDLETVPQYVDVELLNDYNEIAINDEYASEVQMFHM